MPTRPRPKGGLKPKYRRKPAQTLKLFKRIRHVPTPPRLAQQLENHRPAHPVLEIRWPARHLARRAARHIRAVAILQHRAVAVAHSRHCAGVCLLSAQQARLFHSRIFPPCRLRIGRPPCTRAENTEIQNVIQIILGVIDMKLKKNVALIMVAAAMLTSVSARADNPSTGNVGVNTTGASAATGLEQGFVPKEGGIFSEQDDKNRGDKEE